MFLLYFHTTYRFQPNASSCNEIQSHPLLLYTHYEHTHHPCNAARICKSGISKQRRKGHKPNSKRLAVRLD